VQSEIAMNEPNTPQAQPMQTLFPTGGIPVAEKKQQVIESPLKIKRKELDKAIAAIEKRRDKISVLTKEIEALNKQADILTAELSVLRREQ